MTHLTAQAPAKINLLLRVLGKRADGYHELQTVMAFFPLWDTLSFNIIHHPEIRLHCDPPVTGQACDNLVWRAAQRLRETAGVTAGVEIHLVKRIPTAAGLGGGSSDAATTLLALNQLWGLNASRSALMPLALQLGADVPFFVGGRAALAEGIGERLTPWPQLAPFDIVLVNPGVPLATKKVFETWRNPLTNGGPAISISTNTAGDQWRPPLENDLESAALRLLPSIGIIRTALCQTGALDTVMSGSGPTFFGWYPDPSASDTAARHIRHAHPEWRVYVGQTFNGHDPLSASGQQMTG
jgi:4-diphosphocytidyl-2-C-methyl-D-erythritol kinase